MATLQNILAQYTRQGELWEKLDERRIQCHACGHECPIFEGQAGVVQVRPKSVQLALPVGGKLSFSGQSIENPTSSQRTVSR